MFMTVSVYRIGWILTRCLPGNEHEGCQPVPTDCTDLPQLRAASVMSGCQSRHLEGSGLTVLLDRFEHLIVNEPVGRQYASLSRSIRTAPHRRHAAARLGNDERACGNI